MNKEKYIIEYSLNNVSPSVLWTYVGTVNGLADWFADTVTADGKVFIRFRWDEEDVDTKSYFEFRINVIELTGDVILEITDYAYPDEKRDSIDLWNKQISSLRQRLGA